MTVKEIESRVYNAIESCGSDGIMLSKICGKVFESDDIMVYINIETDIVFKTIDKLMSEKVIVNECGHYYMRKAYDQVYS